MLSALRRELALRLGVCGLALALVAGVAASWLETARLDGLVRQLAVTQAQHLVHSLDAGPDHLSSARMDGFVFVHIERAGTIVEHRAPSLAEPVRGKLDELNRQNGAGDAHVNFTEGGRSYMFLAFTQEETGAHFSGLFLVDEELGGRMNRQMGLSALAVFLVVVLTTAALIPVILRLQNRVICHAQDAIDANIDALATLGSAIAKRDSDTDAHNYRVTIYALRLAEALGLPPASIRNLIRGAFLHDVGKIGIPDAILLKPGPLTADEFEVMKTHVSHGLDIIAHSHWLGAAADVVGGHHEKFDGSGYPQGVAGTDIPLSARIFAVVDVFDALTSKRPYKQPYPLSEARAIMLAGRARHFDPDILDRFLSMADALHVAFCSAEDGCVRKAVEAELKRHFEGAPDVLHEASEER